MCIHKYFILIITQGLVYYKPLSICKSQNQVLLVYNLFPHIYLAGGTIVRLLDKTNYHTLNERAFSSQYNHFLSVAFMQQQASSTTTMFYAKFSHERTVIRALLKWHSSQKKSYLLFFSKWKISLCPELNYQTLVTSCE